MKVSNQSHRIRGKNTLEGVIGEDLIARDRERVILQDLAARRDLKLVEHGAARTLLVAALTGVSPVGEWNDEVVTGYPGLIRNGLAVDARCRSD